MKMRTTQDVVQKNNISENHGQGKNISHKTKTKYSRISIKTGKFEV